MKRSACIFTVVTLSLFSSACGLIAPGQASVRTPAVAAETALKATEPVLVAPADPRKVGDFYVHRFSGSYLDAPLTLTEEIVAHDGAVWVIDYTLEEKKGATTLRVRFDPQTDSVLRVSKVDGKLETSVPLASYERMIERTSFAADSNDGLVASGHGTCLVGSNELDCETKTYNVVVGEKQATLNVAHSASVTSGDVTGDITANDGTVIYRSELVEMGNAASPRHGVASR